MMQNGYKPSMNQIQLLILNLFYKIALYVPCDINCDFKKRSLIGLSFTAINSPKLFYPLMENLLIFLDTKCVHLIVYYAIKIDIENKKKKKKVLYYWLQVIVLKNTTYDTPRPSWRKCSQMKLRSRVNPIKNFDLKILN